MIPVISASCSSRRRHGMSGNVLGHKLAIQLPENLDFLLNIVNLIFGSFEVDDLDGYR